MNPSVALYELLEQARRQNPNEVVTWGKLTKVLEEAESGLYLTEQEYDR